MWGIVGEFIKTWLMNTFKVKLKAAAHFLG
jgi:hypothetical protein